MNRQPDAVKRSAVIYSIINTIMESAAWQNPMKVLAPSPLEKVGWGLFLIIYCYFSYFQGVFTIKTSKIFGDIIFLLYICRSFLKFKIMSATVVRIPTSDNTISAELQNKIDKAM